VTTATRLAVDTVIYRDGQAQHRVVVLGPFGMSAADMSPLAVILMHHGFQVIRTDGPASPRTGSLRTYTMSAHERHIERLLNEYPDALFLTVSLASLPFCRALGPAPHRWVGLTPVVDLQYTLQRVIGTDEFVVAPEVLRRKHLEVLGHRVDGEFALDAIAHGYRTESETLAAVRHSRWVGEAHLVYADDDPWVDPATVPRLSDVLRSNGAQVTETPIGARVHELNRHPRAAMAMLTAASRACARLAQLPADQPITFREVLSEGRNLRAATPVVA
jgi:CTP:molybdopterin cytidylyltransferase MocA